MALGGPEFVTFIVRPKDSLKEKLLGLGADYRERQEILLYVRRCDVRIQERSQWRMDDYRSLVQLGVLAELYEISNEELLRTVFGTTKLSFDDVSQWWDINAL